MAKRPTPTAEEMLAVFHDAPHITPFGLQDDDEVRGLTWDSAVYLVRQRLKTTYQKAADWILERGTEDDSPFVILRISGRLVARSSDGEYHGAELPEGWKDSDGYDVSFDRYGRPLLPGSKPADRYSGNVVVARDTLAPLITAARAARATVNAEHESEQQATRREFYGLHSEPMATIENWLAGLDRSGVHEVMRGDPVFEVKTGSDERIWGGPPGHLRISLHGSEIAAFAALIERTYEDGGR